MSPIRTSLCPKAIQHFIKSSMLDCPAKGYVMHFPLSWWFLDNWPPHSSACKQNLSTFIQLCDNLGAPLMGFRKDQGTFDFNFLLTGHSHLEINLPQDNISRVQETLLQWQQNKKATKLEILSFLAYSCMPQNSFDAGMLLQPDCMPLQWKIKNYITTRGLTKISGQTWLGGMLLSALEWSKYS